MALGDRRGDVADARDRPAPEDAGVHVGRPVRLTYLSLAAVAYVTMMGAGPVRAIIVLFAGATVVLVVRGVTTEPPTGPADRPRTSADVTSELVEAQELALELASLTGPESTPGAAGP
ncbi:hypothetical protein [Nocardiopsis sp. NRRL B-16309]|uniref:hypothetical protein n=1 Tax=Nocardiopsis sp. NRRL B-16309 TaxID=1519494 RepID=UPI0018D0FFA7|nr:hypothetical protein [Nocardiopsis sp. NRRL B-16309]